MKKTRKIASLTMVLCLLAALLAGCAGTGGTEANTASPSASPEASASASPSAESTGPQTVVDALGNSVQVPATVKSICATYPAADAIVLMLGGGDKLVATTDYNAKNALFARMLPKITTLPQPFADLTAGNVEQAMSLAPDVIITSGQSNLDILKNAGLTAVAVNTSSIKDLQFTVDLIGQILGGDAVQKAADLIDYYNANIELCTSRTDSIAEADRPTVFYSAGAVLTTEAIGSIVTEWIELAGGINVAAANGVKGMFVDVTQEELMKWDPDIIVCRDAATKDEYAKDPTLSKLSAVKNGKVYVNPMGLYTWCVRSADEAIQPLWAGTVIQPELFSDIDMVKETRDFHSKFYGLDLTDDEINAILFPAP
ncbi:iron complex transport system substrate-binding protein [Sporobacter termitidis DSM 10068]|uniref:Iron complex transport system substrate-binding protein n=1 Tax=Sporobacter termitidis DSM 10068 TaxID=1123282 RepID=A0A1M5WDE8_9FIRM|nr:ABC transporter substrate-binding protein [Sporobacter termitidis]SHH85526.1 iron complex transport system substrate-binding protein [Sporobacter termitidis DSM 10068]